MSNRSLTCLQDPHGMRSPPVLEETRKRRSGSAKSVDDTNSSILTLELPRHALIKVKAWTEDPAFKIIWIEGTSSFCYRSKDNLPRWEPYQNTTSSPPRYILASYDPRYICPTESQPHESASKEEFVLLSLLDSIIAQLQGIFPSLSFRNPALLDRSKRSADVALHIIQKFLEADKVPSLIWVIDGLQFAESANTNTSLIELVRKLRARGYKSCFTTQGTSEVLSKMTFECEQVKASDAIGRIEGPGKGIQL